MPNAQEEPLVIRDVSQILLRDRFNGVRVVTGRATCRPNPVARFIPAPTVLKPSESRLPWKMGVDLSESRELALGEAL